MLRTGRLLREDFLQQSAFDDRDAYCAPDKQYWMLRAIRLAHEAMDGAVGRGVAADDVDRRAGALAQLARLKTARRTRRARRGESLMARLTETLGAL